MKKKKIQNVDLQTSKIRQQALCIYVYSKNVSISTKKNGVIKKKKPIKSEKGHGIGGREPPFLICALTPCEETDTLGKSKTTFFFFFPTTAPSALASTRVRLPASPWFLLPVSDYERQGTAPAPATPQQKPRKPGFRKHRTQRECAFVFSLRI